MLAWLALAVGLGIFWTLGMGIFFGFPLKLFIGGALFGVLLATAMILRGPVDSKRGS